MLFATLDPAMRGIKLPGGREVIVSDTVGFISDLPTHLIEAFRATLEEVQLADIILHVRDVTHPETRAQKDAVMAVLGDLGIETDDERLIEVMNKIDLLPLDERRHLQTYAAHVTEEVGLVRERGAAQLEGLRVEAQGGMAAVSAASGEGIPELLKLLDARLTAQRQSYEIEVKLTDGAALAWLHANGRIAARRDTKTVAKLKVELDAEDYGRFKSRFGKGK